VEGGVEGGVEQCAESSVRSSRIDSEINLSSLEAVPDLGLGEEGAMTKLPEETVLGVLKAR
jgi:hypothetical protein